MKRLPSKLTYANVVATLALFVALGGASYAALKLPKNSVGTKQIKKEAVTGAKIRNGSVTGPKVDLASLGTVPSAAHAESAGSAARADAAATAANAQALQGLSPAQITAASKLACPAGTVEVAGLCFEESARPKRSYNVAVETCAKAGRILPSTSEMVAFSTLTGNTSSFEWAGQSYFDSGETRANAVTATLTAVPLLSSEIAFRCAVPPSN